MISFLLSRMHGKQPHDSMVNTFASALEMPKIDSYLRYTKTLDFLSVCVHPL